MTRAIRLINEGLDFFFDEQRRNGKRRLLRIIRARHVAACITLATGEDCSTSEAGIYLQEYRQAQRLTPQRYQLGCRGYARGARWYIHSGHKLDPKVSEDMIMAHSEWVVQDATNRLTNDCVLELEPAIAGHPIVQPLIDAAKRRIEHAVRDMLADARVFVDQYEQTTGRTTEMITIETPAQIQFVLDLEQRAS